VADKNRKKYRRAAVAILVAGVLAEGARLIAPWPGFSPGASRVVSTFLIVLWATAAIAVVARGRRRSMASVAWAIALSAPLSMLVHAAVTRVGGSWLGLPYMAAAAVLGLLLKRSFVGSRSPIIDVDSAPALPGASTGTPRAP
jgi:hypothetical protein